MSDVELIVKIAKIVLNPDQVRYAKAGESEYLDVDGWWYQKDNKWFPLPDYLHDIAAAWLIVARLQSKGYQVFIESGFADEEDGQWVGITKKRGMGIEGVPYCDIVETAQTVPLAICLVALKAANIED